MPEKSVLEKIKRFSEATGISTEKLNIIIFADDFTSMDCKIAFFNDDPFKCKKFIEFLLKKIETAITFKEAIEVYKVSCGFNMFNLDLISFKRCIALCENLNDVLELNKVVCFSYTYNSDFHKERITIVKKWFQLFE